MCVCVSVCVCVCVGEEALMQEPKFYASSSFLLLHCDFCLSQWRLRSRGPMADDLFSLPEDPCYETWVGG